MKRLVLACGLAACVAREPKRESEPTAKGSIGLAETPLGPPWLAWRERDEVVVMPLGALGVAPTIVDDDGRRSMPPGGGRVRVRGAAVVEWAAGALGARAVLDREGPAVTAPSWVPIVGYRPGAPGTPTTHEAVRIR